MQDSEKKLYPLHFLPRTGETPWGSVTYTLADLGYIDPEVAGGWLAGNTFSELMETYLERVSGDEAFEAFGTQYMPDAYDYYGKAREKAIEREQLLKEINPFMAE